LVREAKEGGERMPGGPKASRSLAWADTAWGLDGEEFAIREAGNHSPRMK